MSTRGADAVGREGLSRILTRCNERGEITTVNARAALGWSSDRFRTMMRCEGRPRTRREGRDYLIDGRDLVNFLALREYVEHGITLTEWARRTHHARKYLVHAIAKRRAPQAIGYV